MSKIWLMICCVTCVVAIPVNAIEKQKRIEPHQVNIRNYEQFIVQIKDDLPLGTSHKGVKSYLSDNNIAYSDVPHEGCFYIMLKKIYSEFFIFTTDLWIRIYVNEKNGLTEIKWDLIRTAF